MHITAEGAYFQIGTTIPAVQELLKNVVKHAGVKNVDIVLSVTDRGIELTVSDQGRGFGPDWAETPPQKQAWDL